MKAAISTIAVAAFGLAFASAPQAQEALAKSNGCLNCHAVATKKVGPAFKDVAAKYKGNAGAEAALVAMLADEKKHPATKVKPEDAKTLVKWVLSM